MLSLPALYVVHILSIKYTRLRALKFANFDVLEKAFGMKGARISKNYTLFFIRAFVLILLILAASNTIYWYYGTGSSFNYVIAIDASISMKADDYKPNRLDSAKEAALIFLDTLNKANVGVVSFTGITYVKQKVTNNMVDVKSAINGINVEDSGGTSLGDAMITSANLFEDNKKANVIILITDGQNNVGIKPEEAVAYLNDKKILVNTIGIGTKEGGEIIQGFNGLSKLDEEKLKFIAEATSGEYFWAKNVDELKKTFSKIAKTKRERLSVELGPMFMMIAVTLLILEWGLMNTRYRMLP